MGESTAAPRDVAAILSFSLLRYVQRAVGGAEADRVRRVAGETRDMNELMQRGAWSSVETTLAMAAEASKLTRDANVGRRAGEELFRFLQEVGMTDTHRARGSVEAALEFVIDMSSRASTGRITTIVDRTGTSMFVEGRSTGLEPTDPFFCDYSVGYWSSIPSVFGASGYAVELECQGRGDERCLTQVAWAKPTATVDIDAAVVRSNQLVVRHEELQQMAADLFAAEDVSSVLDVVVQRAGHAVLAPKFLLAVQLPGEAELLVHHVGFRDDASARRAAVAVLDGRTTTSMLVVDIASKREHYGCLAALYPKGTTGMAFERRLMTSYATHVAAALEATVAFEQARRDRDTAQALLELSSRLAGVASIHDLSQRMADAVAAIGGAGCRGSVYLWDARSNCLRREACDAGTDFSQLPAELFVDEIEGAAELLGRGGPVILDIEELSGDLRQLLSARGAVLNASLPIIARGDLLGLVSASFGHQLGADERRILLDRLSGVADQAATAFDNVRLLERTRHQATHDDLTDLPNRAMLEDRADLVLAAARRAERRSALLFIDLDRFKNVNDTLGHQIGDKLIQQVAARLSRETRGGDTLARLGGDEFVILLSDVAAEAEAIVVAERVVAALSRPFTLAGQELFISCSVGIAVSSPGGTDYAELLQQADAAMYEAKASGRNAWFANVPSRPRREVTDLAIETALHGALRNGELRVVYQPQVALVSGAILGAEALVRWHHPTLGIVPPDVFIPIAEETGLLPAIDRWVRCTALTEVHRWRSTLHPAFRISFNLSTRELRDPGLPRRLAADLRAAGVSPTAVELEITERVVMADNEDLVGILHSLRDVGVRLAIDDFGTGSAVLRRLHRHPVDTLKIDRSFVSDLSAFSSAALVGALLQMGTALGIDVIAEGVETEAQRAVLSSLGCLLGQGYLFSRPVPASAIDGLLRSDFDSDPAARSSFAD